MHCYQYQHQSNVNNLSTNAQEASIIYALQFFYAQDFLDFILLQP